MGTIRNQLQAFLDQADFFFYNKKVVIGNRPYRWCQVPVPSGYPMQSQTHPAILYHPAGWNNHTHWLATTPYPYANVQFENPCIYKANSQSQIPPSQFDPIRKNPIWEWPGGAAYNSDPELFIDNELLYCIVRENENKEYLREIRLFSSSNGEDWNQPKTIYTSKEENRQLLSPSYLRKGDKHFIYFLNGDAGIGKQGSCTGIEIIEGSSLTTPDFQLSQTGKFINKDEVGIEPWHFDLFRYKGLLYMIFCGRDKRKKTFRSPMETYLAVSEDDVNFSIFPTPVIRHLKSYRSSGYVDEKGILHLYFSVIGSFLKDGSDRNIAVTSIPLDELLTEIQTNK